jgi:phosphotransferase system  glucose/maltose/N-acetylglucosamine-specific IIC component
MDVIALVTSITTYISFCFFIKHIDRRTKKLEEKIEKIESDNKQLRDIIKGKLP